MVTKPKKPVVDPVLDSSGKGKNSDTDLSQVDSVINKMDQQIYGKEITDYRNKSSRTEILVQSTLGQIEQHLVTQGIEQPVNRSTDLMTAIQHDESQEATRSQRQSKTNNGNTTGSEQGKSLVNTLASLNKELSKITDISSLIAGQEFRLSNYAVLGQIRDFIVEVREASEAYTDNIIAPDNFNTSSIPITINKSMIRDNDAASQIKSRLAIIDKKYALSDKIQTAITESLSMGDSFIATIPAARIIAQALTEDGVKFANDFTPNVSLAELTASITPGLSDSFLAEHYDRDAGLVKTDSVMTALGGELFKELKENCGADILTGETITETNAIAKTLDMFNDVFALQEDTNDIVQSANKFVKQADVIQARYEDRFGKRGANGGKGKTPRQALDKTGLQLKGRFGSIVRAYQPQNVIKITDGNIVFGYLLIDMLDSNLNIMSNSNCSTFEKRFSDSLQAGKLTVAQKYIKVFAHTIYRKFKIDMNPETIEKYSGFSDVLAALFIRAKNENKRFTVTYAYPNEVQHYKPTTDMYGVSILESVKLFARLYIGVLTNAFMSNAIRKSERLAYYIDVGGDDDPNNSTASVIRSIKQREAKFSNMNDITSTVAAAGEFHDFFIPTINGNRTIDIEPISLGTPREIDNEFIEFLKKSILAGTGVPKAYLGSLDEIDFARTLTMENGRFLRRVVRKQRIYEDPIGETFKEVYRNEFVYDAQQQVDGPYDKELQTAEEIKQNADDKSKTGETAITDVLNSETAVESICISLPVPVTLSIQIQQDQITNVDNQAELLSESQLVLNDPESQDLVKRYFKKALVRDLLPGYDWDAIDAAIENAKKESKKTVPEVPPDNPADAGGGDDNSSF